jgi:hypothetical protein
MKIITLENLKYALGLVNTRIHTQWVTFTTLLGKKVDAVEGKGLTTNDFTDDYKNKLEDVNTKSAGIENISISEEGVMTIKNIHGDEANKANVDVYAKIAHKLATPRSINGVPFDGSENIVINAGGTNDVPCTEGEIKELFGTASPSSSNSSSTTIIAPVDPLL